MLFVVGFDVKERAPREIGQVGYGSGGGNGNGNGRSVEWECG